MFAVIRDDIVQSRLQNIVRVHAQMAPDEWNQLLRFEHKDAGTLLKIAMEAGNEAIIQFFLTKGGEGSVFLGSTESKRLRCTLFDRPDATGINLSVDINNIGRRFLDSGLEMYLRGLPLASGNLTADSPSKTPRDQMGGSRFSEQNTLRSSSHRSAADNPFEVGDLVKHQRHSGDSSVKVSFDMVENAVKSNKCLDQQESIGIVLAVKHGRTQGDSELVVSALNSGNLCSYLCTDLSFADDFDVQVKPLPAPSGPVLSLATTYLPSTSIPRSWGKDKVLSVTDSVLDEHRTETVVDGFTGTFAEWKWSEEKWTMLELCASEALESLSFLVDRIDRDDLPSGVEVWCGTSATSLRMIEDVSLSLPKSSRSQPLSVPLLQCPKARKAVDQDAITFVKLVWRGKNKYSEVRVRGICLTTIPLSVSIGDTVLLRNSYSGPGWNLGPPGSGKTGIVSCMDPNDHHNDLQRIVMVSSPDKFAESYFFRLEWLKNVTCATPRFKAGDTVELDAARFCISICNRCLGDPSFKRCGLVVDAGRLKDGVQRNVQVAYADTDGSVGSTATLVHSVYKSTNLKLVPPPVSIHEDEMESLCEAIAEVVSKEGLSVDPTMLARHHKTAAWSQLFGLLPSSSRESCVCAFLRWQHSRKRPPLANDSKATAIINPSTWSCICCKHDGNSVFEPSCVMCGALPVKCGSCECLTRQQKTCMHCQTDMTKLVEQTVEQFLETRIPVLVQETAAELKAQCNKANLAAVGNKTALAKRLAEEEYYSTQESAISKLDPDTNVLLCPAALTVDKGDSEKRRDFASVAIGVLHHCSSHGTLMIWFEGGETVHVEEKDVALLPKEMPRDESTATLPDYLTALGLPHPRNMGKSRGHELEVLQIDRGTKSLDPNSETEHVMRLNNVVSETLQHFGQTQPSLVDQDTATHTVAWSESMSDEDNDAGNWCALQTIDDLVSRQDGEGNTAAHYLAAANLPLALQALHERGGSRYCKNKHGQTADHIAVRLKQDHADGEFKLYEAIRGGSMLSLDSMGLTSSEHLLVRAALQTPSTLHPSPTMETVLDLIAQGDSDAALLVAQEAMTSDVHAQPIVLIAMLALDNDVSLNLDLIERGLTDYLLAVLQTAEAAGPEETVTLQPAVFFVYYQCFLARHRLKTSSGDDRHAQHALNALRCFPNIAARCSIEKDENAEGETKAESDAHASWLRAKSLFQLQSASMDKLMEMEGLAEAKDIAIEVCKKRLLKKQLGTTSAPDVGCNILVAGEPGPARATAARLLAGVFSEVGGIGPERCTETRAECFLSTPPSGLIVVEDVDAIVNTADSSSATKVVTLLKEKAVGTVAILAGKTAHVQFLAAQEPTCFKKTVFVTGSPRKETIVREMVLAEIAKRKLVLSGHTNLEGVRVDIAAIIARRILCAESDSSKHPDAVYKQVDCFVERNQERTSTKLIEGHRLSALEMVSLTWEDTVGPRPSFENSPALSKLARMTGLESVKKAMNGLVELVSHNYDKVLQGKQPAKVSLHRVFYGNPGTGKTTCAQIYGELLKELGLLSDGSFESCTPSDLMGAAVGTSAQNTKDKIEECKGKVLFIDEAYVLDKKRAGGDGTFYGADVLDTLVEKLDGEAGSDIAVILAGYTQEMADLMTNNPGLRRRFNLDDFGLLFEDLNPAEMRKVLIRKAVRDGLVWESGQVVDHVVRLLVDRQRLPDFGNSGTIASVLNAAEVRMASRLAQKEGSEVLRVEDFVGDVCDVDDVWSGMYHMEVVGALLDRLKALVDAAKADGLAPSSVQQSWHLVVSGPSGTGKTTTARLLARELHKLGLLPSSTVIEESALSLQALYIGQTKASVEKALERARGGVLLVDDAHLLASHPGGRRDYSEDVVQALVSGLSSPKFKGRLVVVLCGPENGMDRLFAIHSGLRGVIGTTHLQLVCWTGKQAADVVVSEMLRQKRGVSTDAAQALFERCTEMSHLPSWSSARDVFDVIIPALYMALSERRSKKHKHSRDTPTSEPNGEGGVCLRTLRAEDVESAFNEIFLSRKPATALATSEPARLDSPEDMATQTLQPRKRSAVVVCRDARVHTKRARAEDDQDNTREAGDKPNGTRMVATAVEQAVKEMGADAVQAALSSGEGPDDRLVKLVMAAGNFKTIEEARTALEAAREDLSGLLGKESEGPVDSEMHAKLNKMGVCPYGFEWLRVDGGYRCAGGFHFVSDEEVSCAN